MYQWSLSYLGICLILLVQVCIEGCHELVQWVCLCTGDYGLPQFLVGSMQGDCQTDTRQILRQLQAIAMFKSESPYLRFGFQGQSLSKEHDIENCIGCSIELKSKINSSCQIHRM